MLNWLISINKEEFINDYNRIMEAVYSSKILHGFGYTVDVAEAGRILGIEVHDHVIVSHTGNMSA